MWTNQPSHDGRDPDPSHLLATLREVKTVNEYKGWVRRELRYAMPHASFLASVGRLYGLGSVPTHRISVEFPLNMIEDLKTAEGAINDPLAASWFKSGKLRQIDLNRLTNTEARQSWPTILGRYGFRNLLVHGVADHRTQHFVVFHIANIYSTESLFSAKLVCALVDEMARVAYNAVSCQPPGQPKVTFWHPTISLTQTEVEIITLIAQGLSNKQIARLRGVSDSTIKTQVSRTGAKVGATRRAEIVAITMPMLSPMPQQTILDFHMENFHTNGRTYT